jgi:hypothetical protein
MGFPSLEHEALLKTQSLLTYSYSLGIGSVPWNGFWFPNYYHLRIFIIFCFLFFSFSMEGICCVTKNQKFAKTIANPFRRGASITVENRVRTTRKNESKIVSPKRRPKFKKQKNESKKE